MHWPLTLVSPKQRNSAAFDESFGRTARALRRSPCSQPLNLSEAVWAVLAGSLHRTDKSWCLTLHLLSLVMVTKEPYEELMAP